MTGTTVARHRMRLRARAALERLAGGDTDLAGLAYADRLRRPVRTSPAS